MMENNQTQKVTKAELTSFNNAFAQVKVKGLTQQPYIDYLYLKIKLSEWVEQIEKSRSEAIKTVFREMGYTDGEKISKEKEAEIAGKLNSVLEKLFSEEVEMDTRVLTSEDFFKSILDNDENKDLTTEVKAMLMKYLVK